MPARPSVIWFLTRLAETQAVPVREQRASMAHNFDGASEEVCHSCGPTTVGAEQTIGSKDDSAGDDKGVGQTKAGRGSQNSSLSGDGLIDGRKVDSESNEQPVDAGHRVRTSSSWPDQDFGQYRCRQDKSGTGLFG
jgi:hypothetical protein